MSWTEAMQARAAAVVRERTEHDTPIFNAVQPMGWDPHDVWLTRVRQPRLVAASAAIERASSFPRR
jgi:hypothetical protein